MRANGVEVAQTKAEGEAFAIPPLLIIDSVVEFLDSHNLGSGELSWSRIGEGQSNVTYRLDRGDETFVLRRGPRPPLPRSTHDMVREARILRTLGAEGIPVPTVLACCEDESVLGVPFYIMAFLDGEIITDQIPPVLDSPVERRRTSEAAITTLLRLHNVDVSSGEIATLGRPAGYLGRQVDRFSSLWTQTTTRDLPEVEQLGRWLGQNLPTSQAASVVHGDFRLGNLMFARDSPARVMAILDWEMATLGDPLADLGYLTATYAEDGFASTPLELTTVTSQDGYLRRDELVEKYASQSSLALDTLPWYQALALWKAAVFCEAIYTRWLNGERPDDTDFAPSLKTGVPQLLAGAREIAGLTTQ